MKRIFIPTTSGSDWQRLLARPDFHWKRGYSAMTTAACWETSNPNLPPEIAHALESVGDESLRNLSLLAAFPEWKVKLPGGKRPSYTDILAICRNETNLIVIGIEAKVDEQFGPTLGKRRAGGMPGQLERIAYLEAQLGSASPLDDSIRYQLLHRTVSALLTARAFHASTAIMLIQSFSRESKWRENFDAFVNALKARPLSADLFEIETVGSPRLLAGWCNGAPEFLEVDLPGTL
jgi:hypothetical protein